MTILFKIYIIISGAVIVEYIFRVILKKLSIENFLPRVYESIGMELGPTEETEKSESKKWFDESEKNEPAQEAETKRQYIRKGEVIEWL